MSNACLPSVAMKSRLGKVSDEIKIKLEGQQKESELATSIYKTVYVFYFMVKRSFMKFSD